MAVRYDKKFMNEINRIVRSYNAKITRLSRMDNDYLLPSKFTRDAVATMKATAVSRADVRRRLKDLQSFTERGGEKNIHVGKTTIPKYQYVNIKRYQRLLRVQTTKKIREYETRHPVSGGKEEPFTFSQYGSQDYLTLKARRYALLDKDLSQMTHKQLSEYLEKLIANTQTRREDIWQNNYIKILEDTALSYGYDPDKLEYIVSKLQSMKSVDFSDLTFINRNIKAIIYYYKLLESIQTNAELKDVGEDVTRNLDEIYEYIDEMIKKYE